MMERDRDYELLSAYLDGALEDDERADLEARLATEADLRRELAALRQTVALVRSLPTLQAPRNFTLTAAQAEQIRPQNTLSTLSSDEPETAAPTNIRTLPTLPRAQTRRASRQPFWLGAAAAVVLGVICVGTLVLSTQNALNNTSSAFRPGASVADATDVALAKTAAENQAEGVGLLSPDAPLPQTQAAIVTGQTGVEESLNDLEADDLTNSAGNGRDDGLFDTVPADGTGGVGGAGGATVPLEPSTTHKLNETLTPMQEEAASLMLSEAATASPMGTLNAVAAPSDPTLMDEAQTPRGRVTFAAGSPAPLPSATVMGYDSTLRMLSPAPTMALTSAAIGGTISELAASSPTFEATMTTLGMFVEPTLMDTFSMEQAETRTDEAGDTANSDGTSTADADAAFAYTVTATQSMPNAQLPPTTLGETESDMQRAAVSFSITEWVLLVLIQIILRVM